MIRELVIIVILISVESYIQKAYTLINPSQDDYSTFGVGDNTSHVIIGTYLYKLRNIDTFDVMQTIALLGGNINDIFEGKTRYHRIFGTQENYDQLLETQPQIIATSINNNEQTKAEGSFAVIDWDHDLMFEKEEDEQIRIIGWIQKLLVGIPNTIVKIPAHYLCKNIGGTPLFKHINHTSYIIEMYGYHNPYLTFKSIFSQDYYGDESDGYSDQCPKNPSTIKLKQILNTTKFSIEKTLHANQGFVGEMDEWISEAQKNNLYEGIVFFDQHPRNI